MEKPCEFCAESRPVVYCKADAAHLCLSCDARVHSANTLSRRHYRALLCEGCRNHPASIWCLDDRMFMCHGCDENLHEASAQHQKRVMSSYMGCPSARDFAVLWGYDWNELQANDSQAVTVSASTGSLAPSASNLNGSRKFCRWMEGSSLTYEANSTKSIFGDDDEVGSNNLRSKIWSQNMQDLGSCEEIDCNDDFKLPDVDLTFRNYEELFGGGQDLTRLVFDENDVACSSIKKDVSFGRTDNGYGKAMEDISVTQSIYIPQSSLEKRNIGPFDQAHHFAGSMDYAYTIRPSYSSLLFSLSNLSAENSGADCLDSGLSPNIMKGEPPWNSPELDNAHSAARENAMIRYKKKKKVRMYGKRT